METAEHCWAQRSALLQQARALRAAIPRQTSAGVADLMRGEIERLEAAAEECRRKIHDLQAAVSA